MKVRDTIALTKEWVDTKGSQVPGFCGAHLLGSILTMQENDLFPTYRDVDLVIVLDREETRPNQMVPYKGLMLECSSRTRGDYGSPQIVLAEPGLAPNLVQGGILSDPKGILGPLHQVVLKMYAQREWVRARCDEERRRALQHLEGLVAAESATRFSFQLTYVLNFLSGLLATAHLRMPTHRRLLVLLGELLESAARSKLYERALALLGCDAMSPAEVREYLEAATVAFERATEVHRTPSPFGFKLRPFVRPYLVEATQEMIDTGYHREAMVWILFFHYLSNAAIQNDAPEDEKPGFQAGFDRLLHGLGHLARATWPARVDQARAMTAEISGIADRVVEHNPDIV
jgi:hypothetical protein